MGIFRILRNKPLNESVSCFCLQTITKRERESFIAAVPREFQRTFTIDSSWKPRST